MTVVRFAYDAQLPESADLRTCTTCPRVLVIVSANRAPIPDRAHRALATIKTKQGPQGVHIQMAFREIAAGSMAHAIRQCPFCGLSVLRTATQCPSCREALPGAEAGAQHGKARAARPAKRSLVRRGLLYMLLAAVIQYFSGGYSGMHIPVAVSSFVSSYLAPLLFLSGLGLTLYGLFGPRNNRLASAQ